MIQYLADLPSNMVGFKASGNITAQDFSNVVMPKVQALVKKTDTLNYLLILDTSLKNFTFGAWVKDALLGIIHLGKWNRAAIVTDEASIRKFTGFFSHLMPGEYKGFEHKELKQAIAWVSGNKYNTTKT